MPEEPVPAFYNKKLLVVALVLAAIVVVVYQVHINQVRKAGQPQRVTLLQYLRDMAAEEIIDRKYLEERTAEQSVAVALRDPVEAGKIDDILGEQLNHPVQRGDWVHYSDVTKFNVRKPSAKLGKGRVAMTIPVDPSRTPGEMLRTEDRVDLLGRLSVNNQPTKTYRIIQGLKVLAIGGRWEEEELSAEPARRAAAALRSYGSVTVEVLPKTSEQLADVLSRVEGRCWIDLRNSSDKPTESDMQVNPELRNLGPPPARPSGSSEP